MTGVENMQRFYSFSAVVSKKLVFLVLCALGLLASSASSSAGKVTFVTEFERNSDWMSQPGFRSRARSILDEVSTQIRSNGDDVFVRVALTDDRNPGVLTATDIALSQMVEVVIGGRRYAATAAWAKIVLGVTDLRTLKTFGGLPFNYDMRLNIDFHAIDYDVDQLSDSLMSALMVGLGQTSWAQGVLPVKDEQNITRAPVRSRLKATVFDRYVSDADGRLMLERSGNCRFNDHRVLNRRTNDDWSFNNHGIHFVGIDDNGNSGPMMLSSVGPGISEEPASDSGTAILAGKVDLSGGSTEQPLNSRQRQFLRGLGYQVLFDGALLGRVEESSDELDKRCGPWRYTPPQWSVPRIVRALALCDYYSCRRNIARRANRSLRFVDFVLFYPQFIVQSADDYFGSFLVKQFGNRINSRIIAANRVDFREMENVERTSAGALVWRVLDVARNELLQSSAKHIRYKSLARQYGVRLGLILRIVQNREDVIDSSSNGNSSGNATGNATGNADLGN